VQPYNSLKAARIHRGLPESSGTAQTAFASSHSSCWPWLVGRVAASTSGLCTGGLTCWRPYCISCVGVHSTFCVRTAAAPLPSLATHHRCSSVQPTQGALLACVGLVAWRLSTFYRWRLRSGLHCPRVLQGWLAIAHKHPLSMHINVHLVRVPLTRPARGNRDHASRLLHRSLHTTPSPSGPVSCSGH
jgi:hypothetical protein